MLVSRARLVFLGVLLISFRSILPVLRLVSCALYTLNFPCCPFVTLLSRPIVSLVFFNTFKWCPMLIIAFH